MISGISKASAYLLLVLAFTIWILNGLVDDWGRLSGSGANLVTFLSGDRAGYITGQTIAVNGGRHMT